MSSSLTLPVTIAECKQEFRQRFDRESSIHAFAPGRVNLIGEHIDYNDGVVLPMAIDRYTVVAGAANNSGFARIFSVQQNNEVAIELSQPIGRRETSWGNYVAGVLYGFRDRGIDLVGFDAVIHSSVPVESGLSSSAALEVAMATFLESLTHVNLEKSEKALLCQAAEHDFARVPCGIMDQFASVFGAANHLVQLDCRTQQVDLIPWTDDGVSILIANSHAPHRLVDGEYAARRKQTADALKKLNLVTYRDLTLEELDSNCDRLSEIEFRRARHVVTEIQRTWDFAASISQRDWERAGQLLIESHISLRDDYEVSCVELDTLIEIATDIGSGGGVFGSRMTGGGFGGCTVSLVASERLDQIQEQFEERYQSRAGIKPTLFATLPCAGAGLIV
jgi:galactokinase